MSETLVDVTIAVHSEVRPVARAVASVLEHTRAPVRVNVVAHNIDPDIIRRNLGAYADHPQLRLLQLQDGIRSPSGPMNHGFASSTAPFITLMGSDDTLAPGAIDSWLALQRQTGAEWVLARILLSRGGNDAYPPVRNARRTRGLDPVRDRLAYRSAPLGLIDRRRFGELRLTEGIPSGEDLVYTLTLNFTANAVAYDLGGPAYVVHDDVEDRVTSEARPLLEDFAWLDHLERAPWFRAAGATARRAIAVKLLRMHVFDALRVRLESDEKLQQNREGFVSLVDRIAALAPGVLALLSVTDRRAFDALRSPATTAAAMRTLVAARDRYTSPTSVLPRNPLRALQAQAPIRTLLPGLLIMRRG